MRLKSFSVNKTDVEKVDFEVEHEGKTIVIVLKEKSWWPLIWGSPVDLVGDWFFKDYWLLFTLPLPWR